MDQNVYDLRKLQPRLPSFGWGDEELGIPVKIYTATKAVFFPKARAKYAEIINRGSETDEQLRELYKDLKAADLLESKEIIAKEKKQINAKIKSLLKKGAAVDEELFDLLDELFPGTKADKVFVPGVWPPYAYNAARYLVACHILGAPYIPQGCKFQHEVAEKMLEIVAQEKADRELRSIEGVYGELERKLKKK